MIQLLMILQSTAPRCWYDDVVAGRADALKLTSRLWREDRSRKRHNITAGSEQTHLKLSTQRAQTSPDLKTKILDSVLNLHHRQNFMRPKIRHVLCLNMFYANPFSSFSIQTSTDKNMLSVKVTQESQDYEITHRAPI